MGFPTAKRRNSAAAGKISAAGLFAAVAAMMVVAVGSPVKSLVVKLVPVVYDVIESFDVGAVAEL